MKAALMLIAFLAGTCTAQNSLPGDAVVIERSRIEAAVHSNRELVLWMMSPVKHYRGPLSENPYTCPELTLGSYYSGVTRLSLLDTRTGRLINTIKLISPDSDVDEFNVPYRIISGMYYLTPGVRKQHEGKPALLKLRDLNGDGMAAETAFFEAEACMGLPTTLVGYSVIQDKVIQYRTEMETAAFEQNFEPKNEGKRVGRRRKNGKLKTESLLWTDYLFSKKPVQPGRWKYEVDYSGRGGCVDRYDVHYEATQEKFVGRLRETCPPPEPELRR